MRSTLLILVAVAIQQTLVHERAAADTPGYQCVVSILNTTSRNLTYYIRTRNHGSDDFGDWFEKEVKSGKGKYHTYPRRLSEMEIKFDRVMYDDSYTQEVRGLEFNTIRVFRKSKWEDGKRYNFMHEPGHPRNLTIRPVR